MPITHDYNMYVYIWTFAYTDINTVWY